MVTEYQIHASVLAYLRSTLPSGWMVVHVPNGGSRNPIEAARLKKLGVMAGWPDISIYGARTGSNGYIPYAGFMEVKSKGGRIQPSQHNVMDRLKDAGFDVAVIRSVEDARECVKAWRLPSKDAAVNDNTDTWIPLGEAVGQVIKNIGKGE
jgi:hypothetical protein